MEWPDGLVPAGFDRFLCDADIAGLKPVLTHPERNQEVQRRPEMVKELVDRGLRIQIGASGLTGLFGRRVRRTAEKLLSEGLVHVIASDAHDPEVRPLVLSEALACAERILGSAAVDLVTTNPARILGLTEEVRASRD